MSSKSTGHSGKSGKSATSSALKTPVVTTPLKLDNGKFVAGMPVVSGYTSPTNQVALVAALSVPILGETLGKDHELALKSNLTTVLISGRSIPVPSISNASAEYVYSGFNGAPDVMVAYSPSEKDIQVGISSHKITNEVQFKAAISSGMAGQIATEKCTLAIVVPSKIGEFGPNVSVSEQMHSVGVTWKLTSW